eukprot:CAMPEP_0176055492 /NCGR_PEP_ID=MMETSP0120_2-20121206/27627_1 /TAXON_ID=160619 /ORGANISM="Kryptoperidinium foliaceum, Strain CCMP 1326" /LENGTH=156 /DNA_ID=CAMNT_0017388987 /DNA_START=58 /DNA_END=529 /DNA_ORIENTATION=-
MGPIRPALWRAFRRPTKQTATPTARRPTKQAATPTAATQRSAFEAEKEETRALRTRREERNACMAPTCERATSPGPLLRSITCNLMKGRAKRCHWRLGAPTLHHALQLTHAWTGSAAFNCSIARCSTLCCAVAAAPLTWSTPTVNLMASTAAFVRR